MAALGMTIEEANMMLGADTLREADAILRAWTVEEADAILRAWTVEEAATMLRECGALSTEELAAEMPTTQELVDQMRADEEQREARLRKKERTAWPY